MVWVGSVPRAQIVYTDKIWGNQNAPLHQFSKVTFLPCYCQSTVTLRAPGTQMGGAVCRSFLQFWISSMKANLLHKFILEGPCHPPLICVTSPSLPLFCLTLCPSIMEFSRSCAHLFLSVVGSFKALNLASDPA
jgi:hypothetical protein